MLKLIFALIITVICSVCGIKKALGLAQRVENIELLIKFIRDIKENIRFSSKPLPQLKQKLLEQPQYSALKNNFNGFYKTEKSEINEFLNGLGKTDTLGQISYCDFYLKHFEQLKSTAQKEKADKAKLYEVLGICAGLAAAIIIL